MRLVRWVLVSRAPVRLAAALIAATSIAAALAACAALPTTASGRGPRIFDVKAQRYIDEPALVAALARARYRLLGEVHDNPEHHALRARLVAALAATGMRAAVVFEQFDLDHEAALRDAQSQRVDAERLADAGHLDRRGWRWPLHRPIVEAALAAGLPIHAGNLSRAALDAAQRSSRKPDAAWYARLRATSWSEAQARTLHDDIVESHCGQLPASVVPRLVLAQRIRDAAMAQALVDDATADGAILIAGNGHVRADLGVPVYLHARGLPDANASSVSVGLVEATPEDERRADFAQAVARDRGVFDYLWITAPASRDDPCAAFSMRPERGVAH
ncbi:MAG: ChaN family lipoprotein [Rudaea sp.]